MAVFWSDAVRNAILDAFESAVGASPKVRIYAGSVPADETAALGGATMLVEYSLASDWMSNAAAGSKSFSSLPISGTAVADGAASFYRIYKADGTTSCEQGIVGISSDDMVIDNTSIANGQTVRITAWSKTAPH